MTISSVYYQESINTNLKMSLNLNDIRALASQEAYKETYFNEVSKVISFCPKGIHSLVNKDDNCIRINIYWTTRTVGTCLNHPRQGKTQLFRRNVDMIQLRSIFKNPRIHTGTGYHHCRKALMPLSLINYQDQYEGFNIGDRAYVKGYTYCTIKSAILSHGSFSGRIKIQYDDGQIYHVFPSQLQVYRDTEGILSGKTLGEETEAKAQLEWLIDEISFLQEQKDQVMAIINDFEEQRRLKAAAEEAERERQELREKLRRLRAEVEEAERKRKAEIEEERLRKEALKESRGRYLDYSLCQGDKVDEWFSQDVISMSCGGNRSTILLYESGGWAWTSGLPKFLHNKLKGRQRTLPSPTYVAIGSLDRYYICFEDGKSQWVGCDGMTKALENSIRQVKSVAFGEDWNSYFIVYDDGYWEYSNVPAALDDLIKRRKCRADLSCVSLGPNGEYYLSARNGRAWWGGMTTDNMKRTKKYSDRIKFLDFGIDDSYILRYS